MTTSAPTSDTKATKGKNTAEKEVDLAAQIDLGDEEGFQEVNKRVAAFWVTATDGRKADASSTLNPLRGVLIDIRYRKPQPVDIKDPSKGMKPPQRVFIIKATARFVVREESPDQGATPGKLRMCEIGEEVWVDERFNFMSMKDYMPITMKGQTVGVEVLWKPERFIPLGGGKNTFRGRFFGRVMDPEECKQLGVAGDIQRFVELGGRHRPPALQAGGTEVSGEEAPF